MISDANVLGQTDSSMNISVVYTGENSEHIRYVIYIDTPVTSGGINSCNDEINEETTSKVQCARTPNFTVYGLSDGTLHNLSITTWLDGLKSEKAFSVQDYTSGYFTTNSIFS